MNEHVQMLRKMQRAIKQTKKHRTNTERRYDAEAFNGCYDRVFVEGESSEKLLNLMRWLLCRWSLVFVSSFEWAFGFTTYCVENTVMFFKGLKRIKRKPESKKNEYICFSGVV